MNEECCLFCVNSWSADDPDGQQALVCFDCEGHEGEKCTVSEDKKCANFKSE